MNTSTLASKAISSCVASSKSIGLTSVKFFVWFYHKVCIPCDSKRKDFRAWFNNYNWFVIISDLRFYELFK